MSKFIEWLSKMFTGTIERPSPSDIVPERSIDEKDGQFIIDTKDLNIPFTKNPNLVPIMMIPDTNSMDGLMDYGHNLMLIHPADEGNDKIMVDWLAAEWLGSNGMLANDVVARVPADWGQPFTYYVIHRIHKVGSDGNGRFPYFVLKGINNTASDGIKLRAENIKFLSLGIIY